MSKRRFGLIILFIFFLSVRVPGFEASWEKPRQLSGLVQDALAFDFNADGLSEIVLIDHEGRIIVLNGPNGKVLWEDRESQTVLSEPIVGRFIGDRRFQILVLRSDRKAVLYEPLTGEIISIQELEYNFSAPPTLYVPPANSQMEPHDAFVFANHNGELRFCQFHTVSRDLKVYQRVRIPGRVVMAPVAVSNDSVTDRDVLATTSDGIIYFCTPDANSPFRFYRIPQGQQAASLPIVADFNRDGNRQIAVIDKDGFLHIADLLEDGATLKRSTVNLLKPTAFPLIAFELEPDGPLGILVETGNELVVVNGADGSIVSRFDLFNPPSTSVGIARHRPGYLEVYVGHENGSLAHYVFENGSLERDSSELFADAKWTQSILVSSFVQLGASDVFASDVRQREAWVFRHDARQQEQPVEWLCAGGNFFRSGLLHDPWDARRRRSLSAMAGEIQMHLAAAQEAATEKNWNAVVNETAEVLELDPLNGNALALKRKASFRRYLAIIILVSIAALIALGVGFYIGRRAWRRQRWLKRARETETDGNIDYAVDAYYYVLSHYPNDEALLIKCGQLFMQQDQYDERSSFVYERCLELLPNHDQFLLAVARSRMALGRDDDDTIDILKKAVELETDKAPMQRYLGLCLLEAGDKQEARRQIESAIRNGDDSFETCELLGNLCVETRYRGQITLSVYDRMFQEGYEEPDFLEAYCESLLERRHFETPAREVCDLALKKNPDLPAALRLCANLALADGDIDTAESCAAQMLESDENSSAGLWIKAHCIAARDQSDEEALDICLKALRLHPGEAAIYRHAGHIIARLKRDDKDSMAVLRRALELNPTDPQLNVAVARHDLDKGKAENAWRLLKVLIESGSTHKDHYLLLAEAGLAIKARDETAEKAYWMAQRQHPDNAEYLQALTEILTAQGRTDERALHVYQKRLQQDPENEDLKRHLVQALHANRHYKEASELARKLIEAGSNDNQLRTIYADSNLRIKNLDTAIEELRRLIEQNPKDSQVLLTLAEALSEKTFIDEENEDLYRRALEVANGHPAVHRALGRIEASRSNDQEAIQYFQNALRADRSSVTDVIDDLQQLLEQRENAMTLHWYLARILIDINHFNDAIDKLNDILQSDPTQKARVVKALDLLLRRDPDNAGALLVRGRLRIASGHLRDARHDLETAYYNNPNNREAAGELCELYEMLLNENEVPELRYRLGEIRYQIEEYDKAIAALQVAVKDYRLEKPAILLLGKCFFGKGMLDLALQEFRKLPIDDETKALLYDLGRTYEKQNDLMGAKTAYRLIFAEDINYRDVQQKFEHLAGTSSSTVNVFEKTATLNGLSEAAKKRYDLINEVGRGAMGIVYKARDRELDEIVALKILPENLSKNQEAISRFKQEARSARRLTHQNVVRIHDIGEEEGRKYISMEFVDGTDLKKIIKSPAELSWEKTIHYVKQIAAALHYAHKIGIIHRDIKPANILISTADIVKVSDFGIAKVVESSDMTADGTILGTPLYMSPEQLLGKPPDPRSDIYSLGILFYECLAGAPPFTEGDLAYQHVHVTPDPIEDIPADLNAIVLKCIAKDIDVRYQTGEELREDLEDFIDL